MTLLVLDSERKASEAAFGVTTDEVVHRLESRLQQHMALITATGAFLEVSGGSITRTSFASFVRGLKLENNFEGIRGIGFALLTQARPEEDAALNSIIAENYKIDRSAWPATDLPQRAVIVLLEPQDDRNQIALGYDMFSQERRRDAMLKALQSGQIHGSAPVELVQEYTTQKQKGFLLYFPVNRTLTAPAQRSGLPRMGGPGFAYAPFRVGDLFRAVLETLPDDFVEMEVSDTTDDEGEIMFRTASFAPENFPRLSTIRHVVAAGREWTLTMHPGSAYIVTSYLYSGLIAFISLLLAVTLAMAMRWQARAMEAMEALHTVSQRALGEKDLMLQEMKHRIKNSIARILAMARQTAAHSQSLDEFTDSFFSRLQAMANAQEMLTRSHWQRADLRALLETELKQVFGENNSGVVLQGPAIELTETATQALGLTFHELATNALKYGDYHTGASKLSIVWSIQCREGRPHLVLDWQEATGIDMDKIGQPGFGTRLIDASIRIELGGEIQRDITADRLNIRITFSLQEK